jgi:NADH:ubiquinone oxidoreductase subunit E
MNILKLERSIALLKPIIWKMPMNKKREAYITLLTAAQKQLPQEVNLVVEEHFIPMLESSRHIADNLLSKGVLND